MIAKLIARAIFAVYSEFEDMRNEKHRENYVASWSDKTKAKAHESETGEWLKAWALAYSDAAQVLVDELKTKPTGGFSCYIKNAHKHQEGDGNSFGIKLTNLVFLFAFRYIS